MNKKNIIIFVFILFSAAFILRTGVAVKQGFFHPMESDSHYYLQLAKSLSQGAGYCVKDSFWPDQPTMQRMPGWPFLVSVGLRVCPFLSPDVVMRLMCMLLDSLNAVLVGWLTWMFFGMVRQSKGDNRARSAPVATAVLGGTRREEAAETAATTVERGGGILFSWALLAGLIYAAHPAALFLVYNGESELLFVTLCLTGFILLLRGGRWMYLASLCFGLSCLVRANYVIWVFAVGGLVIGYWLLVIWEKASGSRAGFTASEPANTPRQNPLPRPLRERAGVRGLSSKSVRMSLLPALFCVVLFLAPSLFWAGRNYQVCGHFPVLSTLRGQTFYGGNNPVVANNMDVWGYWIFPDGIPGEKKASELAKTMSEYELDVYYYGRGKDYVKAEWFSMPRLLLGKFVRAYIPIPWKPNIMSYGVGAYRGLIYLLAIIGIYWLWSVQTKARSTCSDRRLGGAVDKKPPGTAATTAEAAGKWSGVPIFSLVFLAMILTNLAGVLIFWGCFRFAFVLEPLLIPFAAATVGAAISKIPWRPMRRQ